MGSFACQLDPGGCDGLSIWEPTAYNAWRESSLAGKNPQEIGPNLLPASPFPPPTSGNDGLPLNQLGGRVREACSKHANRGKAGVSIPMQPDHTRGRPIMWRHVAQGGRRRGRDGHAANGEREPGTGRGGVSPPRWARHKGCLVWGTWIPEIQPNTLGGGGQVTPPPSHPQTLSAFAQT